MIIKIKSSELKSQGTSSNPELPELEYLHFGGLAPPKNDQSPRKDIIDIARELQCFAAGISALVYCYNLTGLRKILAKEGATNIIELIPRESESIFSGIDYSKIGLGFTMNGRAWLVFRGSDDAWDWDANCRCFKTDRGTHRGFESTWGSFSTIVLRWAETLKPEFQSIVVAGHSLGGAVGLLAARDLAGDGVLCVENVFTFGAPRIGSIAFCEHYNQLAACSTVSNQSTRLGDITFQARLGDDLVPKIPPMFLGFAHVGKDDECLRISSNTINRGSAQTNQAAATNFGYCTSIRYRNSKNWVAESLSWLPVHHWILSQSGNLADSLLSHRMVRYCDLFGNNLSFHRAIGQDRSVIDELSDKTPVNTSESWKCSFVPPPRRQDQFMPERCISTQSFPTLLGIILLILGVVLVLIAMLLFHITPERARFFVIIVFAIACFQIARNVLQELKRS